MKKDYKKHIKSLFESIELDNEQTQELQAGLAQSIEDSIEAQVQEQLKQQQEDIVNQQVQELQQQVQELQQQVQDLEKTNQEQEAQIKQKEEELVLVQQATLQSIDDQIVQAKLEQQAEDEAIAIEQTEKLIQAIDAQKEEESKELNENISEFLDTHLSNKASLQVSLDLRAKYEALNETVDAIKSALISGEVLASGVKKEADRIMNEAKQFGNKRVDESTKLNKSVNILNERVEKLKLENSKLRGKVLLAEKLKFVKPSVAKKLNEELQDKTIEEIEQEFDEIQSDIEKKEDQEKKAIRQKQKGAQVQKKLDQEAEENKGEENNKPLNESDDKAIFGKLVQNSIRK